MDEKKYKILIAEDDKDIVEILRIFINNEGYDVISVSDGKSAIDLIESEQPDLVLCDIMMPVLDGYKVIEKIRYYNNNIPIIIISAKDQDSDKILGLNIGADDYITKPFNPLEAIAHIKALLRRFYKLGGSEYITNQPLTVGDLTLDVENSLVIKRGREIVLTSKELKILLFFMKNPGKIVTKVQINTFVNGDYFEADDNSLLVHLSKIRDKIEDDPKKPKYITTIRGLGYKFDNNN